MIVRLGYVAIALGLPKVTSSSNVTYTNYKKLYLVKSIKNIRKDWEWIDASSFIL
ncbi:MAG TPA: hypothetical protein GXZ21_03960 [Clostridiales bacterium]|nr:hypothetical protein [Clostridiales bacterium]